MSYFESYKSNKLLVSLQNEKESQNIIVRHLARSSKECVCEITISREATYRYELSEYHRIGSLYLEIQLRREDVREGCFLVERRRRVVVDLVIDARSGSREVFPCPRYHVPTLLFQNLH